jgi:hypothetical protein
MRRAALLASLLVACSGCLQMDGARIPPSGPAPLPPDGWPATGGAADHGPLHLRILPTQAQRGANVTFLLQLVADQPVRLTHRGCPDALLDAWIDLNGTRTWLADVSDAHAVSTCALASLTLEPGTHATLASWNGRAGDRPAPPGTYVVHATTGFLDEALEAQATVRVPPTS